MIICVDQCVKEAYHWGALRGTSVNSQRFGCVTSSLRFGGGAVGYLPIADSSKLVCPLQLLYSLSAISTPGAKISPLILWARSLPGYKVTDFEQRLLWALVQTGLVGLEKPHNRYFFVCLTDFPSVDFSSLEGKTTSAEEHHHQPNPVIF